MSQLLGALSALFKPKKKKRKVRRAMPYAASDAAASDSDAAVRAIAFYLPQYHPIPENDEWWGKGFTEWTNVTKASPLYDGHYQPRQPADLGYYDLRIAEVRKAQADMARKYGIHGFCYYHYWFGGKRLLERPFEEVLRTGEPDFPFCLCWANENWSRRWDGSENELLMEQRYSDEDFKAFAESLIPVFKDPRYIRINGRPLFLVYRPSIIPGVNRAIKIWRDIWRKEIGEVHLCASLSFGDLDPIRYGFDSASEFPPHGNWTTNQLDDEKRAQGLTGGIYEYDETVLTYLLRAMPSYTFFRTAFPAWDNTARKGKAAHIFNNSTPEAYEFWLRSIIEQTKKRYEGDERIVFINAWNEWAEGAYLEPDRKHGHAYLAATKRAIYGASNADKVPALLREYLLRKDESMAFLADDIAALLQQRDKTIELMGSFAKHNILSNEYFHLKPLIAGQPRFITSHTANPQLHFSIDNLHTGLSREDTHMPPSESLFIKGWAFCPVIESRSVTVILKNVDSEEYFHSVFYRCTKRDDVVEHFSSYPPSITSNAGFSGRIATKNLPCGKYQLGLSVKNGNSYGLGWWPHHLIVE